MSLRRYVVRLADVSGAQIAKPAGQSQGRLQRPKSADLYYVHPGAHMSAHRLSLSLAILLLSGFQRGVAQCDLLRSMVNGYRAIERGDTDAAVASLTPAA